MTSGRRHARPARPRGDPGTLLPLHRARAGRCRGRVDPPPGHPAAGTRANS